MPEESRNKVIPYHEQRHMNFIALIFALILIYLIVQIIRMFTGEEYSVYELQKEEMYSAASIRRGIILREEVPVTSVLSGSLNYLTSEGQKLGKNSPVYTTRDLSFFAESAVGSVDASELSSADLSAIKKRLEESASRSDEQFYLHYLDMEDLKATVKSSFLQNSGLSLESLVRDGNGVAYTENSGFILFRTDSLDQALPEDLTAESFVEENLNTTVYSTGRPVNVGSFAYKLVPDDSFSLVFPMDENDQIRYEGKSYVSVELNKIRTTQNAAFRSFTASDGSVLGVLSFSKYGSSYLTDRFADFSLREEEVYGFRIPVSSVLTKEFLLVPSDYIMKSAGEGTKVFKEYTDSKGSSHVTPVSISVYAVRGDMVYISSTKLEVGDFLIRPQETRISRVEDGREVEKSVFEADYAGRYHLAVTAPLTGVFNVNKGYCIFRQVEILEKTRDGYYYLIAPNTSYGLSAYDRIMEDAETATDNQIVFQ